MCLAGLAADLPRKHMRYYLIESERVTALPVSPAEISDFAVLLQFPKDLDGRRFPTARVLALFNSVSGIEPVKRFTNRKAAVKRLWAALEALPLGSSGRDSKQNRLIALMQRPSGACMAELMEATGWKAHSVRGVVSATLRKKLGLNVALGVNGNTRVYRITS
jgi:hypothetical protein